MTQNETIDLLSVLKAAYPNFYKNMTRKDADSVIALWEGMFKDEPAEIVTLAVKRHIATDTKGFPPHIGAIKEAIAKIMNPSDMTELEAWGLVQKALRNGYYGAQEEFEKLPPAVQRAVGGASQLRDWAMMDTETVQSVVASNFQRSYRVTSQRERDWEKLPSGLRSFVQEIAESTFGRLDAPKTEIMVSDQTKQNAINTLLNSK